MLLSVEFRELRWRLYLREKVFECFIFFLSFCEFYVGIDSFKEMDFRIASKGSCSLTIKVLF